MHLSEEGLSAFELNRRFRPMDMACGRECVSKLEVL